MTEIATIKRRMRMELQGALGLGNGGRVRGSLIGLTVLCLSLVVTPSASAEFGVAKWDGLISGDSSGAPFTQAGGHPYQIETTIEFNSHQIESEVTGPRQYPDEPIKDVLAELPAGLFGNTTAFPECTRLQLGVSPEGSDVNLEEICPIGSILGTAYVKNGTLFGNDMIIAAPIYNMVPPLGGPAQFGFRVLGVPVILDAAVRQDGEKFHVGIDSKNISQALPLTGARLVFWGVPYDSSHDNARCWQINNSLISGPPDPLCVSSIPTTKPQSILGQHPVLLTLPTRCTEPEGGLRFDVAIDSWDHPGVFDTASFLTHEPAPNDAVQRGTENCGVVPSSPEIDLLPTVKSAESASGLDVELTVPSEGLLNPEGVAQSHLKKVEVTLPQGMTINPAQADGLGVCTPAQYGAESAEGAPGSGCPSTSKIGTVQVDTPLLHEPLLGNLYVAAPHDNPFDSLLALYIVAKDREMGVMVKAAGEVIPDQRTGQLTTVFDNLPPAPFSKFTLHFREGQRSPLSTPPACGTYTTVTKFTPYSAPSKVITRTSSFEVTQGVHGGPCPSGGLPPFKPGLLAGTLNNRAGSYSPFNVRLTRNDGEQEFTNFSIKLPPGVIGKIAGLGYCSDAAIEAARHKSGAEELANPSCPASSQVGTTLAGAGVGSVLTYAPGKIYYAGPYHGNPISIAAITAAKVGPFDLGTVVVRFGLDVNPETAEIFIDSTGSDPIPHIIKGITTHIRDIRAYNDRPEFVLNPTSCERTSTASTVLGSGLDFASAHDDQPVTVSTPFQAADCAALPFKPKLALRLLGGTKRGAHPKLRAQLTMKPGQANIARAQVTLPRSEFLDQGHIKTICTRVQFRAGDVPGEKCPPGSVYGYARAFTPILDYPLEGPVILRSSEHQLPDLVAALHSAAIDINVIGRIDSVKNGSLRTTFESVPDAPVSKFVLTMQGGRKGLLVNSTDLCKGTHRAQVQFDAHNGKIKDFAPPLKARCGKAHRKHNPAPATSPYRGRIP